MLTEVVPNLLWWSSQPKQSGLIRGLAIENLWDLCDAGDDDPQSIRNAARYHREPLDDSDDFEPDNLLRIANDVVKAIAAAERTLVHCTFGKNRSGIIVALVLRALLDISGAEALDRVRRLRVNAVNNTAFAAWLVSLPPPGKAVGVRVASPFSLLTA